MESRDKRGTAETFCPAVLTAPTIGKRRAAAEDLGKTGNPTAIPALVTALGDSSPEVRMAAILALGRIRDSAGVPGLVCALGDADPRVRAAAISALGMIKDRSVSLALIHCLDDKDLTVRIGAVEILGKLGDTRALGPLEKFLLDPFSDMRDTAARAIERIRR